MNASGKNEGTEGPITREEFARRGSADDLGEMFSELLQETLPYHMMGKLTVQECWALGFGPACPCGERGLAPGEELVEDEDGEVCAMCASALSREGEAS